MCINDDAVLLTAASPGGVYSGAGVFGGTFNPATAGVGTHVITNIISEGCGDTATYTVTVNPQPNVSFMPEITNGCEPLRVPFTNTGDSGVECVWDFGDGSSSYSCASPSHVYFNSGIYDVSLTVTDVNGCSATSTMSDIIEVYPVPRASFDFGPQPATTINTEIRFRDHSTGADNWEWDFAGMGGSTDQDPTFFFPEEPAEYIVREVVGNEYGCMDTTYRTVIISEQFLIYVPNTITPDGDNFNESFLPYFNGIDIYNYHLEIYNRWGEMLFESYDVSRGWDGTYGGEVVPPGVYVWHIITDEITSDRKLEFHGHVTVLE